MQKTKTKIYVIGSQILRAPEVCINLNEWKWKGFQFNKRDYFPFFTSNQCFSQFEYYARTHLHI